MQIRTILLLAVALSGCATTRVKGDVSDLKPTVEALHRHFRWKDFRGATDFMVQEKRGPFIKARLDKKDDRDLTVSDYQLEDCVVSGDQRQAACVSRISWIRLPSMTETTDTVTTNFMWDGRNWRMMSQEGGPFQPELAPSPNQPAPAPAPSEPPPTVESK